MRRLRGQGLFVIGVPLVAMACSLFAMWQLQTETQNAVGLMVRSNARFFTSQLLLLRMVDAETGLRGYAATRDPRFLDPYRTSIGVLPALIVDVRGAGQVLPAAIATQSRAVARAATVERALLLRIDRDLQAGRRTGIAGELLDGKSHMDALRVLVAQLQATEERLIVSRRERTARDQREMLSAIAVEFAVGAIAAAAAILLFTHRVVRRLALLVVKTEDIGAGRGAGMPLGGGDEIATVDAAVSRMAVAIQARTEELARSHAILDERNAELRTANSELENFSYSVSHDLRTPVRAVDSFSGRLEQQYGRQLDPEGRRLLGVIRSETGRMGRLIDDLLHLSKLGRRHFQRTAVDMNALVNDVADRNRHAGGDGVTISMTPLPDASGDRALLRQVWENLIANAIKYSSTQPAPAITISGTADASGTTYHVTDNGIGFKMKFADKIFDVFERLHGIAEFPGSGVGLAIVKRIIERHGGRVWAYGEPDRGATFSFSLPAN